MTVPVRIYGHWVSQPTRAVLWAMKMKGAPVEFIRNDPTAGDGEKDDYLALFPSGLYPGMIDGDVQITEAPAILTHLAETRGWDDLYPTTATDAKKRAQVNQWLHWHHGNTRLATEHFFRPVLRTTLGKLDKSSIPSRFGKGKPEFETVCRVMKYGCFANAQPFMCGDAPTLADINAYCEFDQLEAFGILDDAGVTGFPEVIAWMDRMKQLPHHDEVRKSLQKLAVLVKPTVEQYRADLKAQK